MTEQWQELKETITEMRDNDGTGTQQETCKFLANYMEILEKQMQQPCEDCISRQKALDCFEQTNTRQGAKYAIETLPSVTPTSEDIKEAYIKGYDYGVKDWFKSKTQSCEDAVSRSELLSHDFIITAQNGISHRVIYATRVEEAPSVTPERPNLDMIKRIRKAIDEMTEIHSDGEFYIKNLDAKWIISKYLCGAEMSGGEEE